MFAIQSWLRLSLFNLLVVALLGLLMRYKIGFEFPFLDQKNLQHAHSHFAFTGWVSHTLMVLMIHHFRNNPVFAWHKYRRILRFNLVASYGMLVFFIMQGYGFFSILFSTASMAASFVFAWRFLSDLKSVQNRELAHSWFKAGIYFSILSALGTLVLIYLMATKTVSEPVYLSAIYFYLHFQYNGYFFFVCMGLFYAFAQLQQSGQRFYRTAFWIFAFGCAPAFLLSILWLDLPIWLYALAVLSAIAQVYAWFRLLLILARSKNGWSVSNWPMRPLLIFIAFAASVKLLLQLASTVPSVSQLAFGFRPIVIAYLHLVLLALISLFLLYYIFSTRSLPMTRAMKTGLTIFATGVIANELVLGVQGIASLDYIPIPFVNELLFAAAIMLVSGVGIMAVAVSKQRFYD